MEIRRSALSETMERAVAMSNLRNEIGNLSAAEREIVPGHAAHGELEPELTACFAGENAAGRLSTVLKLATAFGGANAALVGMGRPAHASWLATRHRAHPAVVGGGRC